MDASRLNICIPDDKVCIDDIGFDYWLEKLEDETPFSIFDVKPQSYNPTTFRKFIYSSIN